MEDWQTVEVCLLLLQVCLFVYTLSFVSLLPLDVIVLLVPLYSLIFVCSPNMLGVCVCVCVCDGVFVCVVCMCYIYIYIYVCVCMCCVCDGV